MANAICDRCGFRRKHRELVKEWTGLMVCKATCLDPKPNERPRNTAREGAPIRNPRPDPTPIYRDPSDNGRGDL